MYHVNSYINESIRLIDTNMEAVKMCVSEEGHSAVCLGLMSSPVKNARIEDNAI